jgi:hypothetical protein
MKKKKYKRISVQKKPKRSNSIKPVLAAALILLFGHSSTCPNLGIQFVQKLRYLEIHELI